MVRRLECGKNPPLQHSGYVSTYLRYFTMSYYDLIVKSYGELYGSEQVAKYSVAVKARPGGRVLDIGCGIGLLYDYLLHHIQAEPEIYVGIDISSESLRELRSRHRDTGLVEVVAADAEYPPIREKSRFTYLYAFTLYACDYGDFQPVLGIVDMDFVEEAAVTVMCRDREAACPEGFAKIAYLNRIEVLCLKVPPGGLEPPTPRSPGDLQPGALPG